MFLDLANKLYTSGVTFTEVSKIQFYAIPGDLT
jgi:hypothetical protein